ncbi:unnamed protein product [Auanema sp. JU1783]|nr:unnamed protein product [Auanema sp. JU1783]
MPLVDTCMHDSKIKLNKVDFKFPFPNFSRSGLKMYSLLFFREFVGRISSLISWRLPELEIFIVLYNQQNVDVSYTIENAADLRTHSYTV